ncbi:hypothetical protein QFZ35_000472 [Arthrobacter ulcerisalmonis]|nr:hypothetical protein [Arthrobacter ulcerisalmonis]MDQ0661974.1 hypothetical protein [Arthrobacter ulcerisalmonis]
MIGTARRHEEPSLAGLVAMVVFEPFDDNAATGCRQPDNAASEPARDLGGKIRAIYSGECRQLAVLTKAQTDLVRPGILARLARQALIGMAEFHESINPELTREARADSIVFRSDK